MTNWEKEKANGSGRWRRGPITSRWVEQTSSTQSKSCAEGCRSRPSPQIAEYAPQDLPWSIPKDGLSQTFHRQMKPSLTHKRLLVSYSQTKYPRLGALELFGSQGGAHHLKFLYVSWVVLSPFVLWLKTRCLFPEE